MKPNAICAAELPRLVGSMNGGKQRVTRILFSLAIQFGETNLSQNVHWAFHCVGSFDEGLSWMTGSLSCEIELVRGHYGATEHCPWPEIEAK